MLPVALVSVQMVMVCVGFTYMFGGQHPSGDYEVWVSNLQNKCDGMSLDEG